MMNNEAKVGIGDLKAAKAPNSLITYSLGSCVGVALYDRENRIGGLAHIMLPDSNGFSKITNPAKFADLSIPLLVDEIRKMGGKKENLVAKIAGGARMFDFSDSSLLLDIGSRNVNAVTRILSGLNIPIKAREIGGNSGRTMVLDVGSGEVTIRTAHREIKKI
jgi:chemotaxis protein CheD